MNREVWEGSGTWLYLEAVECLRIGNLDGGADSISVTSSIDVENSIANMSRPRTDLSRLRALEWRALDLKGDRIVTGAGRRSCTASGESSLSGSYPVTGAAVTLGEREFTWDMVG